MALIVKTSRAQELLNKMRSDCREDPVQGWICDEDGDFTRTTESMKVWMRPKTTTSQLTFYVLGPKGRAISTVAYAIYHSKMINLLLTKHDKLFDSARATAMPMSGDIIGKNS